LGHPVLSGHRNRRKLLKTLSFSLGLTALNSSMSVTYRRGTTDDAAGLAEFATRAFTQTYAAFNTPQDIRDYVATSYGVTQQERELSDPAMITVLAESDDALIGYSQVRRKEVPSCVTQDAPAEIYRFYVDASAHGKGVAQRLMDESLSAAHDLGAKHIWLGVWDRNARAIAFYRKRGFIEIGDQHFQLGSDRQRDLVMIRPVD
jgi:ribosomal protein S18 acetylase RimI-like enzyme